MSDKEQEELEKEAIDYEKSEWTKMSRGALTDIANDYASGYQSCRSKYSASPEEVKEMIELLDKANMYMRLNDEWRERYDPLLQKLNQNKG